MNNNTPFKTNNIFLSIEEPELKTVKEVREWLINGKSPNYMTHDGRPLWWLTAANKNEEGLDELLLAGADINIINREKINWVMACLDFNISFWLFQAGFKKIDIKWWEPDIFGRSPFFSEKLSKEMANMLCSYLWANFISWENLKINGQYPEDFFKETNPEINKILLHWKKRLRFNKPIKYINGIEKK